MHNLKLALTVLINSLCNDQVMRYAVHYLLMKCTNTFCITHLYNIIHLLYRMDRKKFHNNHSVKHKKSKIQPCTHASPSWMMHTAYEIYLYSCPVLANSTTCCSETKRSTRCTFLFYLLSNHLAVTRRFSPLQGRMVNELIIISYDMISIRIK